MAHSTLTENEARPEEAVRVEADARAPGTFKTVVVGVDGTSTSRDAIALGETLRAHDGRLILAHVVLAQVPVYRNFHSTPVGKSSHEMLERERAAAGVSADLTGMFAPSVRSGLDQLADDYDADLLVVGASRRGVIRRLVDRIWTRRSRGNSARAVAVAPFAYAMRGQLADGGAHGEVSLHTAKSSQVGHGTSV
jgi:nucleotide-binding universal stress UspA family protein